MVLRNYPNQQPWKEPSCGLKLRMTLRYGFSVYTIENLCWYCAAADQATFYDFAIQSDASLLILPAELRIQIWEDVLNPPSPSVKRRKPPFSLLFTCKQVYAETRAMAVRNFTIHEDELPSYTYQYLDLFEYSGPG